jgi:hypothetical protein
MLRDFYVKYHVLDLTQIAGGPLAPLDPDFPTQGSGDNFWVVVK